MNSRESGPIPNWISGATTVNFTSFKNLIFMLIIGTFFKSHIEKKSQPDAAVAITDSCAYKIYVYM